MKLENEKIEKAQDPQLNIAVVVRSAYFVSVEGRGDMFVVADNIAEACDKLDRLTDKNYIFIHSRSFECAI